MENGSMDEREDDEGDEKKDGFKQKELLDGLLDG